MMQADLSSRSTWTIHTYNMSTDMLSIKLAAHPYQILTVYCYILFKENAATATRRRLVS